MGPMRLDEYGNPVHEVYRRTVVRNEAGQLVNQVEETFSDVSQFWTYEPEAYLAQPSYSRDFQG